MEKTYVLYSRTRKVIYMNDQPNTEFWSLYLRSKYAKDKWVMTDIDHVDYRNLMHYLRQNDVDYRRVNLLDSTKTAVKKLNNEIYLAMKQTATKTMMDIMNEGADTFLVYKSVREEAVVIYMGPHLKEALFHYNGSAGIQFIEVWRNGVCRDYITNEMEYISLCERTKAAMV